MIKNVKKNGSDRHYQENIGRNDKDARIDINKDGVVDRF